MPGHNTRAQLLAAAAFLIALLALVGYSYGVTLHYGFSSRMGLALPTALAFAALAAGILTYDPERGLIALAASPSAGGVMLRRLLPAAIGLPLLLGWLRVLGERAGLYDTAVGITLMVTATIVLLSLLIWHNARTLQVLDAARTQTEAALRQAHAQLERRIEERTAALAASEHALHDHQARLQALLDNSPSIIFVKDLAGRYLLINKALETLLHLTRGSIKGKTDFDLYAPDIAASFRAADQQAAGADSALTFEEEVMHPDGIHHFLSIKFPLRDEAGHAYAVCGISTDITERKQAEVFQSQGIKFTRDGFFFRVGCHRRLFKGQHVVHFDRPIGMHHNFFHQELNHRLAILVA